MDRFQAFIEQRLGIACSPWQTRRLAGLLEAQRAPSRGHGGAASDGLARGEISPEELRRLADLLSIGETYFFRDRAQIDAFAGVVLPAIARGAAGDRPIRVLSAGCSSGEEPYSLAIALRERHAELCARVVIRAIDVSPAAIREARAGRYSSWSLRATSVRERERWFRREGEAYRLSDDIRAMVAFEERNLFEPAPDFWGKDAFDVIFCRNVMIYFSERSVRALVARFAGALAPGGFLFLGYSESLRGVSDAFETQHAPDAYYYRLEDRSLGAPPRPRASARAEVTAPGARESWAEVIQHASTRIMELTSAPRAPRGPALSARGEGLTEPRSVFGGVLSLIAEERFGEARARVEGMLRSSPPSPDLSLALAVIMIGLGRFGEAEEACERLVGADMSAAGAHYLIGLCREHAGDLPRAMEHHRASIRLDPSFGLPRLRLGVLARRSGDLRAAKSELRQALEALASERPERVVLFGGGFQRETLLDLCAAQLRAAGGSP